jgi:ubiquitin
MTNAEKQKAHRQRAREKQLADALIANEWRAFCIMLRHLGGNAQMTIHNATAVNDLEIIQNMTTEALAAGGLQRQEVEEKSRK